MKKEVENAVSSCCKEKVYATNNGGNTSWHICGKCQEACGAIYLEKEELAEIKQSSEV